MTDGVAVAGTPTSMAAIDQQLEPYDPSRVHGYRLSASRPASASSGMLAALPEAERRRGHRPAPANAPPTIVAGAVILVESMRAFGLESIQVGEHDILYGAAVKAAL